MNLSDAIGLELERRERGIGTANIAELRDILLSAAHKISEQQARIEALEKLLDPETLARKIGDWDFTHNDDYFCFKFGGDGDNGEMLIDALAALLKETAQ